MKPILGLLNILFGLGYCGVPWPFLREYFRLSELFPQTATPTAFFSVVMILYGLFSLYAGVVMLREKEFPLFFYIMPLVSFILLGPFVFLLVIPIYNLSASF